MATIFYPAQSSGGAVSDPLSLGTLTGSQVQVTNLQVTTGGSLSPAENLGAQLGTNAKSFGASYLGQVIIATGIVQPPNGGQLYVRGIIADGASAVGVKIGNGFNLDNATAEICGFYNDDFTTKKLGVHKEGKLMFLSSDSSISPGATTINKAAGRAAIASGQTSVTVTNSLVTTGSFVHITPMDIDTNVTSFKCVEASSSFTVTVDSACASTFRFKFLVTN